MSDVYGRFTERARKVLELSLREALSLGHNYVGTEHILLALIRENEGVASRVLDSLDCTAERVRNEVIRQLTTPPKLSAAQIEENRIRAIVSEVIAEHVDAIRSAVEGA